MIAAIGNIEQLEVLELQAESQKRFAKLKSGVWNAISVLRY
jgi:hypothetical protein